ncbi:division plane positioning ATPase MipZ [Streptomyces sp. NEAU-Y11]|uniref:division plane positioning ATPase MipZ n=1 Tax=Streptomyces cucumeris TaxID=2962890 RepID=UPI0020C837EC|nr:ParA family protein [Streptomyces sp. NEAU-Y11]MCP9209682.1 ParA family protein [Streptomyces sp. NEAU-Y11]
MTADPSSLNLPMDTARCLPTSQLREDPRVKIATLPRQQYKDLLAEFTLSINLIKKWLDDVAGCLIVGVGMLKGGTGKTTSSIFLALYLAICLGLKVCVVDTDDNSQSVDNWYKLRESREEEVPFDLVTYDPKDEEGPDLDDVLDELSKQYDVVLVDVGGAGKEAYWELCKMAHFLLLPVAPSGFETHRIAPTIKVASRGGKANPNRLKIFVALIKCSGNNTLADDQRGAIEVALAPLDRSKVDVFLVNENFQISSSTYYPRAWEHTPKRSQLDEFGMLFRYAMKEVAS